MWEKFKEIFRIKCAKVEDPLLDTIINEKGVQLKEKLSLLKLSSVELVKSSTKLRFQVMDELITDIERRK